MNSDELISALGSVGVPVGAVRTVRQALNSDHARARNIVQEFVHPTEGPFPGLRTPLTLTGYDSPRVATPPLLGADTRRVLRERLQLTDAAIDDLAKRGVI
jgi:crotonobetainyl-CoA:carnitine CoA-transferase CaiB-like acyl-CoA transferase